MFKKLFLLFLIVFSISSVFAYLPGQPTGDMPSLLSKTSSRTIDGFHCIYDETRDVMRYAFPDEPIYFSTEPQQMTKDALDFVDSHPQIFGTNRNELRPSASNHRIGRYWLNFTQIHRGIPVCDGMVYFRIFGDGRVWGIGSRAIMKFEPNDANARISTDDARAYAIEYIRENVDNGVAKNVDNRDELVWLPNDGIGKLCWQVFVDGTHPNRYEVYVDAINGRILGWTNLVNYYDVSGNVQINYLPDFFDDPFESAGFKNGRISLNFVQSTYTDTTGYYYIDAWVGGTYQPIKSLLTGLYTDVRLMSGGSDASFTDYIIPPATYNWLWNTDYAQNDELNLYYHTNFIHDWYKIIDPDMTGLDYPVPARARIADMPENAYWDGYGINFGAGGTYTRNFALFSNVIYHEYTHGVTGWIYTGIHMPYSGEPGAINEAFSDFIPCSITDYPYAGWRVSRDDSYFRTLENDLVYPDDLIGEVHADSRMISGSFWDIRAGVYPTRTGWADTLIHFTRYSGAIMFNDFAEECFFTADDDGDISNGCPNLVLIANSFAKHGLGPGYYPSLQVQLDSIIDLDDGDNFPSAGNRFQVYLTINFHNDFPYPTVEDLYSIGQFDDEQIEPITAYESLGDLPNGGQVQTVFTYRVDNDALPHYSSINVLAGTPDIALHQIGEIEIPIGSPQILLVNNSNNEDYADYFKNALHDIPIVYDYMNATDSMPTDDEMSRFFAVCWFTGDSANSISEQNIIAIGNYLDDGGKIVLTGQDGFDGVEYHDFLDNYFGAQMENDSVFSTIVRGIDGDTLGDGFDMMITSAAGASNQHSSSTLSPTDGISFAYYPIADNPVAAVRYDNGIFKSVILGFGMEAIGVSAGMNINIRSALTKILNWFGTQIYSDIPEKNNRKPDEINISAYPNPFNSSCKITIEQGVVPTGRDSPAMVEIYDIMGNVVGANAVRPIDEGRMLYAHSNCAFIWTPDKTNASGLYFVRVSIGEQTITRKIIYLK